MVLGGVVLRLVASSRTPVDAIFVDSRSGDRTSGCSSTIKSLELKLLPLVVLAQWYQYWSLREHSL